MLYFLRLRENGLSMGARPSEITNLLQAWSSGDEAALAQLAERVYPELRLMARRYLKNQRQANTLQTTALVHEAYLRLGDQQNPSWRDRSHFYGVAARLMRQILVDHARRRQAGKRRGHNVPLEETVSFARTKCGPDRAR